MATIEIGGLRHTRFGHGQQLSAIIRIGDAAHEVYFRTGDGWLRRGIEPFLALGLLPAMRVGQDLHVADPVSPLLLRNLHVLQRRFVEQYPQLRVVTIEAEADSSPRPASPGRTALFFSGGVDSFFTLLERQHEISDLVFVHGFDIPLESDALHRAALSMARRVADGTGKHLVHVETNLRRFADRYADWGQHVHGPALAAVALALSRQIPRTLIAGERRGGTQSASRLDFDPLWSSEEVEIIHAGHDVTRFQKLKRVGSHPLARQSLRVCWENRHGRVNCCACSKCLRNMAALRAHGTLTQIQTFEYPLDLKALSRLRLAEQPPNGIDGLREILGLLDRTGSDPQLARAVRECLEERHYRGMVHLVRRACGRAVRGWNGAIANLPTRLRIKP
jgi:hypothetical protein